MVLNPNLKIEGTYLSCGIDEIPYKIINKPNRKYPKEFIVDYIRGYKSII
jgi:hypothetical protein